MHKKRCTNCGSEDIIFEAVVRWNPRRREYYVENLFDYAYCNSCENECSVEDVITELNVNTKVL